jgi:hypothetical protein
VAAASAAAPAWAETAPRPEPDEKLDGGLMGPHQEREQTGHQIAIGSDQGLGPGAQSGPATRLGTGAKRLPALGQTPTRPAATGLATGS